jgi:hypothetical protein
MPALAYAGGRGVAERAVPGSRVRADTGNEGIRRITGENRNKVVLGRIQSHVGRRRTRRRRQRWIAAELLRVSAGERAGAAGGDDGRVADVEAVANRQSRIARVRPARIFGRGNARHGVKRRILFDHPHVVGERRVGGGRALPKSEGIPHRDGEAAGGGKVHSDERGCLTLHTLRVGREISECA